MPTSHVEPPQLLMPGHSAPEVSADLAEERDWIPPLVAPAAVAR
ncbi:hypothetical protein ACFQ78_32475 [Streptomyces sp. NPDC056519]